MILSCDYSGFSVILTVSIDNVSSAEKIIENLIKIGIENCSYNWSNDVIISQD